MKHDPVQPKEYTFLSLFFLFLGVLLLNWPILSIVGEGGLGALAYLFVVWICGITALICLSAIARERYTKEGEEQDT